MVFVMTTPHVPASRISLWRSTSLSLASAGFITVILSVGLVILACVVVGPTSRRIRGYDYDLWHALSEYTWILAYLIPILLIAASVGGVIGGLVFQSIGRRGRRERGRLTFSMLVGGFSAATFAIFASIPTFLTSPSDGLTSYTVYFIVGLILHTTTLFFAARRTFLVSDRRVPRTSS